MKKILLGLFLGLSGIVMAAAVNEDVNGTLTINANVIAPLKIEQTTAMDFGDIVLGAAVNAATPGVMTITGAKGNTVIVSVANTTISRSDKADSTVPVSLTISDNAGAQTLDITSGELRRTITGSIAANATKYVGTYTGTATVTVKYN